MARHSTFFKGVREQKAADDKAGIENNYLILSGGDWFTGEIYINIYIQPNLQYYLMQFFKVDVIKAEVLLNSGFKEQSCSLNPDLRSTLAVRSTLKIASHELDSVALIPFLRV